jgi:CRP-like cAMP-binding protein
MVEGSVLLNMHGENGRKASLCVLHAPAFFGELEMLSVLPHTVEVEALDDCIFYCVDADEAAALMKTNSVFLNRLFDYVSHRSAILAQRLMRAFTGSLESRLAEFILEFRRGDFYTESDGFAAAYLGVSDRRIRTIMADFRRQGILQKSGRHDRIAAEEKLFDLAGAPSLIV